MFIRGINLKNVNSHCLAHKVFVTLHNKSQLILQIKPLVYDYSAEHLTTFKSSYCHWAVLSGTVYTAVAKVALRFKYFNKTQVCDYSNENYWAILWLQRHKGCFLLLSLWMCVTIQMKAIEQYVQVVLFAVLYKMVLTFKSLDEALVCDHSNKSCRAVLSCGNV